MSNPDTPPIGPNSPAESDQPLRPQMSLRGLIAVVFKCSLLFVIIVPILKIGSDPMAEVAYWHEAAAFEDYLNQDFEAAIKHLDNAIEVDPDNVNLYRRRGEYLGLAGRWKGSLADHDKALELESDDIPTLLRRGNALSKLGRHNEAIENAKLIMGLSANQPDSLPMRLNNLAYNRAVADEDLAQAREEIQQSLNSSASALHARRISFICRDESVVDTLAYIQFRQGEYEAALENLDEAVKKAEQKFDVLFGPESKSEHFLDRFNAVDARELKMFRRQFSEALAVIRYHRALVLQKLHETQRAAEDLDRVRELGFTPGDDLF